MEVMEDGLKMPNARSFGSICTLSQLIFFSWRDHFQSLETWSEEGGDIMCGGDEKLLG